MLKDTILGKKVLYNNNYDNKLLFPISRVNSADKYNIIDQELIYGFDIWNCYEFSWLNNKGKPEIRILVITIDVHSENIIESKSLKLYLNSFASTKFANELEVLNLLTKDLENIVQGDIKLEMLKLNNVLGTKLVAFEGINIDMLDIAVESYKFDNQLLKLSNNQNYVSEELFSNLLKSNCPVTNQPDFASVYIKYIGHQLCHESLLKYIISFRDVQEFHEQCVESIFKDIRNITKAQELLVYARYTRRGGIDINPVRSTNKSLLEGINNFRQIRQ